MTGAVLAAKERRVSDRRAETLNTAAIVIGGICLLALAFAESLGLESSTARYTLIGGVVASGTSCPQLRHW